MVARGRTRIEAVTIKSINKERAIDDFDLTGCHDKKETTKNTTHSRNRIRSEEKGREEGEENGMIMLISLVSSL